MYMDLSSTVCHLAGFSPAIALWLVLGDFIPPGISPQAGVTLVIQALLAARPSLILSTCLKQRSKLIGILTLRIFILYILAVSAKLRPYGSSYFRAH